MKKAHRINRPTARIALLIFAAMLVWLGLHVLADFRVSESGKVEFVPAATQADAQQYTLCVRGLTRGEPGAQTEVIECLPGAEFGIYAADAQGNMAPWPDPEAPYRALRIRTEDEPVAFALPDKTEFFLLQESAPMGYQPANQGYWKLGEQRELVLDNAMPGGAVITAVDSNGEKQAGAKLCLTAQDQTKFEGVSGADGTWTLGALPAGNYLLDSIEPPKGMLPAKDAQRVVIVRDAAWATAQMLYVEPGKLAIQAEQVAIDQTGQVVRVPLAGLTCEVFDAENRAAVSLDTGEPAKLVCDQRGWAQASLPAGSYTVRVDQRSAQGNLLQAEAYQVQVTDEKTSTLQVVTGSPECRVRVQVFGLAAQTAEVPLSGVQVTLKHEGKTYGPYVADARGAALSDALPAGAYTVAATGLPEGYALPLTAQVNGDDIAWQTEALQAGPATLVDMELACPAVQSARFALRAGALGEDGALQPQPVGEVTLAVLDAHGQPVLGDDGQPMIVRTDADGGFALTLAAGQYAVAATKAPDGILKKVPVALTLPAEDGAVVMLPTRDARLILRAVDDSGARLTGASFRVTDAAGKQGFDLTCDTTGQAVSPMLKPGTYHVQSLDSPAGFAPIEPMSIECAAGRFTERSLAHKEQGTLRIAVLADTMDEQGERQQTPLADVPVALLKLRDGGHVDNAADYAPYPSEQAPLMLRTDAQGIAKFLGATPRLPAGHYLAQVSLWPEGFTAGASAKPAEVTDGEVIESTVAAASTLGGLKLTLTDAANPGVPLAGATFALYPSDGQQAARQLASDEQGVMLALNLPEGDYVLQQISSPEGYSPLGTQTIHVPGALVIDTVITNAQMGLLAADKRGYTFNANMQAFHVPLTGKYGVFTQVEGQYRPYPNEASQYVLCANAEPGPGEYSEVALPAAPEGTAYYLCEVPGTAAQGYVDDRAYHEVYVVSGQRTQAEIAATSDKGFFAMTLHDGVTGASVPGGNFALYAPRANGQSWEVEPALRFVAEGGSYQNDMAMPAGRYKLVMEQAPQGYMLDASVSPVEAEIEIPPYMQQGNPMAQIGWMVTPLPTTAQALGGSIAPIARDGQILIAHDWQGGAAMPLSGVALEAALTDRVAGITGVSVGQASDRDHTALDAKVAYRLIDGGWRWDDVRTLPGIQLGAQQVSLADVPQRIGAVRIWYVDQASGAPQVGANFVPGDVAITTAGPKAQNVETTYSYRVQYLDEQGQPVESAPTYAERASADMGGGQPAPISLADKQPGGVVGSVWLEQAPDDGYQDATESAAGLPPITVQLLRAANLNVVQETQTDAQGHFRFDVTEMGNYRVRFALPEEYLPAPYKGNSAFACAISDAAQGMTDAFPISTSQRWTNLYAGLVHAAKAQGIVWLDHNQNGARDGDETGLGDVAVALLRKTVAGAEQQVAQTVTDEQGRYHFGGLTDGAYLVRFTLPDSTVFAKDAPVSEKAGTGSLALDVAQGASCEIAPVGMLKLGSIGGTIWNDADSDGRQSANETRQANLRVELLDERAQTVLASALTDMQGQYRFANLRPGTYVVRMTLRGQYTFTQGDAIVRSEGTIGYTGPITLAMGEQYANLNAGTLIPTGVVVHAWGDDNYQGVRGAYEKGVRGVRVALLPADAQVPTDLSALDWRETGADGTVRYDRMTPGDYRLAYALPDGWQPTRRAEQGDRASILPEDGASQGVTEPFAVAPGLGAHRVEMGLILPAMVQGVVWLDGDDSGLRDAGEGGLAGVTVWLQNADTGVSTDPVTTDAEGHYTLSGLMPGKYTLHVRLPDGCVFTGNARSVAKGLPARADTQEGASAAPFAIAMGQTVEQMDIGAVRLGGLSGALWADEDYSGAREDGEQPLAGVAVTLLRAEGVRETPIGEVQTAADGSFALPALRPGTYRLSFALPEGFVPTRSDEAAQRVAFLPHERNVVRTAPITLAAGEQIADITLGALRLGTVSGVAWEDADFDGNRGEAEKPLRNVVVTLWREGEQQDEQIATVLTDRAGAYYFDGLKPDYYWVHFSLPEGYVFTREGGQSKPASDEGREAETEVFSIAMGEAVTGIDVGALHTASMSGSVWVDSNNNGLPDPGEPGLIGTIVRVVSNAQTDRVAAEVMTDEQGMWRAEGLMPGTYTLTAELPQEYLFARSPARANTRASIIADVDEVEGDAAPMTLVHGEQRNNLYIGAVHSAYFDGTVWSDENDSGQREDGDGRLQGVTVSLIGEGALHETDTNADGFYEFTGVRPGTYQLACDLPEGYLFARPKTQDQVALLYDESSGSAQSKPFAMEQGELRQGQDIGAVREAAITAQVWMDANQDNARSGEEQGVEKTTVELLDAITRDVLATQRADIDGKVTFAALRAGSYQLRYTLPQDYILAEGTPLTDLNALQTEGLGPCIDLVAGQIVDTTPVATVLSVTIRGQVWEDTDATGLRETSEPPLPDTVVTLLGIGADGARTPLRTVNVDTYGRYAFESVRPGNYAVRFTLPGTYLFTNFHVGTDDVSSKVPVPEGQIGETEPFVAVMGQVLSHMDAGAIMPGVLGDTVWVDENGNGLQDYGEAPLPGVKLVLFRLYTGRAEQVVAEAVSDAYGLYRFHAVRPGQYRLRVELPSGYTFTVNRPDLSEIDSDVPEAPGAAGDTAPFNIRSGETRRDIDVGAKKQ